MVKVGGMPRPGPRKDLDGERILTGAEALLRQRGDPRKISLRALATEIGVTPNAIYTYFPALDAVWHELADRALGRLRPRELRDWACPHCALLALAGRAGELFEDVAVANLLRYQPVLGECSFELSETVMALCTGGLLSPRDAHDLIMGWFWGSTALQEQGWTAATDLIRERGDVGDVAERFPLVHGRAPASPTEQAAALLRGIGVTCTR